MIAPTTLGPAAGPFHHLPVYGVFLALLVHGSDPATAPPVRWFPRRRAAGRPDLVAA